MLAWCSPDTYRSRQEKRCLRACAKCTDTDSSRACSKSHPSLCSQLIHSIVSNDSVSGQRRPWSDSADTKADLGLRCLHIPENTFSHGAAHVKYETRNKNPVSILYKSIAGRYRPVRVADGPITDYCRFIKKMLAGKLTNACTSA